MSHDSAAVEAKQKIVNPITRWLLRCSSVETTYSDPGTSNIQYSSTVRDDFRRRCLPPCFSRAQALCGKHLVLVQEETTNSADYLTVRRDEAFFPFPSMPLVALLGTHTGPMKLHLPLTPETRQDKSFSKVRNAMRVGELYDALRGSHRCLRL